MTEAKGGDARLPPPFLDRHYRICLAGLWAACSAIATLMAWPAVREFRFPDPDDIMRLLEVRDWLAGQSWFDVTQYRLNPPHGFSMHWSRLVDLPLAAVIALLKPWLGQRVAETAAALVVPMITFGIVMALIGALVRRRFGAGPALAAAAFCLISAGNIYATRPMRIDHHGWEAAAGLAMVLALTGRRNRTGAALAGLFAALWTNISLEGIAFTAGAAAWLGLRWAVHPQQESYRLPVFLSMLTGAATLLFLLVHGTALLSRTYCDAISPVHIVTFCVATLLTALACRLRPSALAGRLAALAVAGAASAAVYIFWAPQCLSGPFNMLDPLSYRLWYLNVKEGRPVWELGGSEALLWLGYPLLGLAGAVVAWRNTREQPLRAFLLDYCALLTIATAIGALVMRAGAFSNLLAIPGGVMFILFAFARTESWRLALRAPLRAMAALLLCPFGVMLIISLSAGPSKKDEAVAISCNRYLTADNLAALDALPRTTLLAPLDQSPALVASTHHWAIGASYHRNAGAIHDVLAFFTAEDQEARSIASRHEAHYVALCPSGRDVALMAKLYPKGLAARLKEGRPPDWLRPIELTGSDGMRLYAVQ